MGLRPWLAWTAIALLGLAVTWLDLRQPFVRNELVYARAAEHVIEAGYDPRPVVADSRLSYDKPIGFAWLGAPLVARLGSHVGLRVLSALGTLLFLASVLAFLRAFDPFGWGARERAAALWLVGLNPIVVYQFWSAHPDSLFAGMVLATWTLALKLVDQPEHAPLRRSLALFALCAGALVVKNYALILLAGVPLFGLLYLPRLLRRPQRPWRMLAGVSAALVAAGLFAWLGWKGGNPLVRLAGEGGGVGQYDRGALATSAAGTWIQVGVLVLVNVPVALFFVPRARSWNRRFAAGAIAFALVYVAGLMDFPTTYYNMRYFLPILPFVALPAVEGWRRTGARTQRIGAGAHALAALALIAVFGVGALHRRAAPWIPELVFERGYGRQGLLDNLRMSAHLARADELARANRAVEPGGVLYLVDCGYYGDAMHGVYEKAGLLRGDIRTRYVRADALEPSEPTFYAWTFRGGERTLARFGEVTALGPGLYRVTRG